MDNEFIKNILENTNNSRQIKSSIKEIDSEVEEIVRNFYKPYLTFEKNAKNLEDTLEKLKGYMYVKNADDIPKSYYVRYLNNKYFYDLTLCKGGFLISIEENKLKLYTGKIYIKVDRNKVTLFMKLKQNDKFRVLLNDLDEKKNSKSI